MNIENSNQSSPQPINKGLMVIKATVLALFIVLVVLSLFFVMLKKNKRKTEHHFINNCSQTKTIMVDNAIETIQLHGNVLNVLTKIDPKNNSQELIRIDNICGNEINRITFEIKQ